MGKTKTEKPKYTIVSWSGGKDSTATIILAHILGIPIDEIIISLVWFDKKRGISAESTKHLRWIMEFAIPLFESWGYKVTTVSSDKDYLYYFWFVRQSSEKHPETIGKYYGFPIGGSCRIQRLKEEPMTQYLAQLKKKYKIVQFMGICADEKDRLEKMKERKNQVSLLEQENKTQWDAKQLCREYGLLSPIYDYGRKRGGCWFCPNQPIEELAELKTTEPDKYNELVTLSREKNTVARGFMYGRTFEQINEAVDAYIANPPPKQLTIFD